MRGKDVPPAGPRGGTRLARSRRASRPVLRTIHRAEKPEKTSRSFLKRDSWKTWHVSGMGTRNQQRKVYERDGLVHLNAERGFFFVVWASVFFFFVTTQTVGDRGGPGRRCRFPFKMRSRHFCGLLFSIKLLECFGNNKNPKKYIR